MKSQIYIALFLALLAFATHLPALDAGFVNFDDNLFITKNHIVQQGLSIDTMRWAFSFDTQTGWSPLAWVSYLIDYEMFGLNPRGYHAVNLLFHTINVVLLFFLLTRITKQTFPAAIVAAIFAVHPQHVESIAWIAERRDVLFMCFGLITLHAYHHYTLRPSAGRYLLVALAYALGLMSKPMLVTFPALLLLLDYWPLRRTEQSNVTWKKLLIEKLPLLAMACVAALFTVLIQQRIGATADLEGVSLLLRLTNTPVAVASYLFRFVWPMQLAFFYPYPLPPGLPSSAAFLASSLLLVGLSLFAWKSRVTQPWVIVGWLWFLIALIPVCGIVQVGAQRSADRYTYLPMLGVYIAIAWSIAQMRFSSGLAAVLLIALSGWSVQAWRQTAVWRSSETLCRHAIKVTDHNAVAHNNLATALLDHKTKPSTEVALRHLREAVRLRPAEAIFQKNIGHTLAKLGRVEESMPYFVEATLLNPKDVIAHYQLGEALRQTGDLPGAIRCLEWAVACEPDDAPSQYKLGLLYQDVGRLDDARRQFMQTLKIDPQHKAAHLSLEDMDKASNTSP